MEVETFNKTLIKNISDLKNYYHATYYHCLESNFKDHIHDNSCNSSCNIINECYFKRIKECNHDEKEHQNFIVWFVQIEEKIKQCQ